VHVPGFAADTALAICCIIGRTRLHLFLLRITIVNLRPFWILLVRQICVSREKHFKPSFLGRFQQVAVA
jgi:hypothetical protein